MDLRELIARALYERRNKGLNNCWAWDDSGMDDDHPGARDRLYREADAILAALNAADLVVVPREPTEEMKAQAEVAWMNRRLDDYASDPIRDSYAAPYGLYRIVVWAGNACWSCL